MGFDHITAGEHVPDEINAVIEIPSRGSPVKYEVDKASGLVSVDRFLATPMFYPCEYGFIPQTLSEDGDPLDVLVISPYPLFPRSIIRCRPVGMLRMSDESGKDMKIIAVPTLKLTPIYQHVKTLSDLEKGLLAAIQHFFQHYKELEAGKWSKVDGFEEAAVAKQEILASIKRYQQKGSV